ncbi:hypothetical protein V2I01_38400 [Micromonospora sp. BRA006-A]|nr:hypothetical protein [Micromonospora sp. BRA006-A]
MTHPAYPVRTSRLLLRPVTLGDLDDVHAWQRRRTWSAGWRAPRRVPGRSPWRR